jgi:transposase
MTSNKLLSCLLKMKGFCVTWFEFTSDTVMRVGVKPHKTGCRCPKCGRRCEIVRHLSECRSWDDIVVCGRRCIFIYAPKEIYCPTHGRIQEQIPWAAPYARITYRLEHLVLKLSQLMTQRAVCELLHMPKSTLSDLLHRSIQRMREGHCIADIKKLGVDEISYCKGHKYATIIYNLDNASVVWVGPGKGREAIDEFFEKGLTAQQREKIKFASCDMSKAYIGAIEHWCPNAILVLDRFHIVKALNSAVDEVRKQQWREARDNNRKVLKGLRWLLFFHSRNRTKADTRKLNELKKLNRRIWRAWILKDEFEAFWEYVYQGSAESFLKGWIQSAKRSRLKPMKDFAKMLDRHSHRILPFIGSRVTNAMSEGINRVIKIVKNRASGFANLEAFTDMIFLTVGDVDLPAQISTEFHTL